MRELLAVALAFGLMLILLRKNVNFGVTMLITSATLCVVAGIAPLTVFNVIKTTFTSEKNITTLLVVFTVSILGGLCGRYGILTKVVDSMQDIIPNTKVVIMLIPAIIGLLVMPGGAILSAPFVDSVGDQIGISQPRKAAINLVFRHVAMMCMPFSTSVLLAISMNPEIGLYELIGLNLFFMILNFICGYYCFLRPVKCEKRVKKAAAGESVKSFFLNLSPIYVSILLNIVTGIPLYLCILVGIGITYLICDKKDFLKNFKDSINFNVVFTVAGVLVLQSCISSLDGLMEIITGGLGSGGWTAAIVLGLGAAFFGAITGLSNAAMGIVLPLVALLSVPHATSLYLTFVVFVGAYFGYFFSPLHVCQVFTNEYLKVSTGEIYKEYRTYGVMLGVGTVLLFAVMGFVMM